MEKNDMMDAVQHPGFEARICEIVHQLAEEYRRGLPLNQAVPWLSVILGTHPASELLRALEEAGCGFCDSEDLFDHLRIAPMLTSEILYRFRVGDMGYAEGSASLADIGRRLLDYGYTECPAEVVPQLRLQHMFGLHQDHWVLHEPVLSCENKTECYWLGDSIDSGQPFIFSTGALFEAIPDCSDYVVCKRAPT